MCVFSSCVNFVGKTDITKETLGFRRRDGLQDLAFMHCRTTFSAIFLISMPTKLACEFVIVEGGTSFLLLRGGSSFTLSSYFIT